MSEKFLTFFRYGLMLLALALLAVLLSQIDLGELSAVLENASTGWVLLGLIFILLNFSFAAKRYQNLVAPAMSYVAVLETIMASYLLNYASMVQGLGIGAKIGLMKARHVPASRSVAGIGVEIILDLMFTAVIALIYALNHPLWDLADSIPAWSVMLLMSLGLVLLFSLARVLHRWQFFQHVRTELIAIIKSGRWAWVVVSTAGIWISAGLGFYCLIAALGYGPPVSGFDTFSAICIGYIVGLVSMIPGGLGVRELSWAYFVAGESLSLEMAGLLALLYRLLSIALIAVSLLGVSRLSGGRGESNGGD